MTGALCGYVGVPPGYAVEPDDLSCHGGVTYTAPCDEGGHICHVPLPGEPAHVTWIGFDCAHAWDQMPAMPYMYGTYRNLAYVQGEVEQLAEQLGLTDDELRKRCSELFARGLIHQ